MRKYGWRTDDSIKKITPKGLLKSERGEGGKKDNISNILRNI
jgi:hypothetical protein